MIREYTEQLAEWVAQKKTLKKDKNLASFLSVYDDVKSAIDLGYGKKTIWMNLHESKRIDFNYDVFVSYVNRMIKSSKRKSKNKDDEAIHLKEETQDFKFSQAKNIQDLI